MIIYQCIKHESNILIFSKDIKWKPFFTVEKGSSPIIIGEFYPKLNLTYHIKYESSTLIFSKDIKWKQFLFRTDMTDGRDGRGGCTDSGDTICTLIENGGA